MGNAFTIPEAIKHLPDYLPEGEYVKMVYNNTDYFIQSRGIGNIILNNVIGSFLPGNSVQGFYDPFTGTFDRSDISNYYVTMENLTNGKISSWANNKNLKYYIKDFASDKKINLEKAVFTINKKQTTSFGVSRLTIVNNDIKYLSNLKI